LPAFRPGLYSAAREFADKLQEPRLKVSETKSARENSFYFQIPHKARLRAQQRHLFRVTAKSRFIREISLIRRPSFNSPSISLKLWNMIENPLHLKEIQAKADPFIPAI
jgi:hypothetical protein